MTKLDFESVLLEKEQQDLLVAFVEASRNVSRDQKQKFIVIQTLGSKLAKVYHPGLPADFSEAYRGNIEILANERLLNLSYGQHGSMQFDVTPLGIRYYEWLKRKEGEPVRQIEQEMHAYLESDTFCKKYPGVFEKWREAESLLWEADTEENQTIIGHLCREALQEFVTCLVDEFQPPEVDADKSHTVARLKAVLGCFSWLGSTERPFLESLIGYWGALSDLIQRQEHGAQREKESLIWEDARRVVFHTIVMMYEVAHTVGRRPA